MSKNGKPINSAEADRLRAKLQQVEELRNRIFAATKADQANLPEAQCADLVVQYPLMHSLLFMHFLEGGPEKGASLTLWGKDDGIGAVFSVSAWSKKAFFNAGSLQELLECIESHLRDPESKWHSERKAKRPTKSHGYRKH
jgi:hypothetical protein